MRRSIRALIAAAIAGASILGGARAAVIAAAPALSISNTATVDYTDVAGIAYHTVSNTVTAVAVSAMSVSPKETAPNAAVDGYPVGSSPSITFTIANVGNVADAYTVTSVSASAGSVVAVGFQTASGPVPVTLGQTLSPVIPIGGSIPVVVTLATTGVPVGTAIQVALVARSANPGAQTDTGTRYALTAGLPSIVGPSGGTSPVQKLVNGARSVRAAPGATVTYSIAFENGGTAPATNVTIADTLPSGMHVVPDTVKINGAPPPSPPTISGRTLTVTLPSLAPNAPVTLTFDAAIDAAGAMGATLVNIATVRADGVASVTSLPASVFVGTGDVIFDGFGGASAFVGGANVAIVDPVTLAPIVPGGSAAAPNLTNADPFVTATDGRYGWGLGSAQVGSAANPAAYLMTVSAPGFRNRKIAVRLAADAAFPGVTLYDATLTALDGQPLASPGGFSLVDGPVTVHDVTNLLGNIPVFAPSVLTVSKSADRQIATAGDRVMFTIPFTNASKATLADGRAVDILPPGFAYARGTARVDGVAAEPLVAGGTLTWSFPAVAPGGTHTIAYATVVLPNVPDRSTLVNTITVSGSAFGANTSASANASVRVSGGAFASATVITGRVFVDAANRGFFASGARGVAGVRIFLEDGESVATDRDGRYSFPSVRPGMHVLRLDVTTLPPGTRTREAGYDSPFSSKRLVHGILDAGMLRDVNFALEGAS